MDSNQEYMTHGLHANDRRGFTAFKTVVRRLRQRDPNGERTRWRKCSEITNYAIAREMADLTVDEGHVSLDLPVQVPEFTLKLQDVYIRAVSVDGRPLTRVDGRGAFENDTFYREGEFTLAAFTPDRRAVTVEIA